MIELMSLNYTYPEDDHKALHDISMRVEKGETLLVAGNSGSGKSTLLRVMNGLVPHFFGGRFKGIAVIADMDTRKATPIQIAGKVGTVFQEPGNRFLTNNLLDEIAFGMELVGLPGIEIQERVEGIVDRFGLDRLVDRSLDQLSAGEQQRVAVAAALSRRPEIFLLDEPISQLDRLSAQEMLDWIKELQEQLELTVVITEHRLDRILRYVDRIAHLTQTGEIDQIGSAQSVAGGMPFRNPLSHAAQTLGLPSTLDPPVLSQLKVVLKGLAFPTQLPPNGAGNERLAAKGVSFAYDGVSALTDAHIRVREGEIIALLGRNGAGKSTFLRCLMGLLRVQEGEIWLDGERVKGGSVSEMAKKVAYVPQWPSELLFADSVMEELTFTLHNHGLLDDPPISPLDLLQTLGLEETAERYPRDLSAGQKQRLALAAVLVTKPGVILLDEPTLGMDLESKDTLADLLLKWKGEGAGMVVATHDVEFAATIADRVVVLDKGRVIARGPTAETLFSRQELQTALQQFSGRAYPATIRDLQKSLMMRGEGDADNGAGTRMV